jgi:aminotransferase
MEKGMNNAIAERVRKISFSGIRKYFDLLTSMEGVISLGIGEPDIATPWHISEAGISSVQKGYTMYTSNYGMIELRQELARHLRNRYGLDYDPDTELLITSGSSEALDLAMRAILNDGDEVIAPDPNYVAYMPCTILAGGTFVPVPTCIENDFKVEAAEIERRVTKRSKAIILGYPNNPTGTVMDKSALVQIAVVAQRHDLLVISDEIYDRLVYGVEHTCFAALPDMRERTILIGGFSKSYAMTGWRIGYVAGPVGILEAMMMIHPIRSTGLTSVEFAEKLLIEEKVAVIPGSAFGRCGEGYVRCCYAVAPPAIEKALERMKRFVGRYQA